MICSKAGCALALTQLGRVLGNVELLHLLNTAARPSHLAISERRATPLMALSDESCWGQVPFDALAQQLEATHCHSARQRTLITGFAIPAKSFSSA